MPKKKSDTQRKQINIRITVNEYQLIKQRWKQFNIPASTAAREYLSKGTVTITPSINAEDRIEIRKQGVNLNEISHDIKTVLLLGLVPHDLVERFQSVDKRIDAYMTIARVLYPAIFKALTGDHQQ